MNPPIRKPNPCPLPSGSLIGIFGHWHGRRVRELLGETGILESNSRETGLRKKSVKKMMKWSVKKEIIPHGTRIICKPREGALISFSRMESFLDLFSQS